MAGTSRFTFNLSGQNTECNIKAKLRIMQTLILVVLLLCLFIAFTLPVWPQANKFACGGHLDKASSTAAAHTYLSRPSIVGSQYSSVLKQP